MLLQNVQPLPLAKVSNAKSRPPTNRCAIAAQVGRVTPCAPDELRFTAACRRRPALPQLRISGGVRELQ
jgi:hypothetical protein